MRANSEYRQTSAQFLKAFPELVDRFSPEDRALADDGPHPFFAFVAGQVVPDLFADEVKNAELLERIFGFFEDLANHSNEDIRGIVGLSVCEKIASNEVLLQKFKRYAGSVTIKMCVDLLK
ncbi:MAG: hypothetical protein HYV14_00615 [Elusimicrobia bacterium]|nr:hypothetical protein [Elusimicrobiota bacterium]